MLRTSSRNLCSFCSFFFTLMQIITYVSTLPLQDKSQNKNMTNTTYSKQ
uniref:Uncharacterized protein n=1 Tax=Rhizophora mucronata TaxID=61149 RepID=A0A2P2NU94_RHIMU